MRLHDESHQLRTLVAHKTCRKSDTLARQVESLGEWLSETRRQLDMQAAIIAEQGATIAELRANVKRLKALAASYAGAWAEARSQ